MKVSPRAKAITAAQKMFRKPEDFLIFDSETTGLDKTSQIIELAAIDFTGKVVFNQRIRPTVAISPTAYNIHGISEQQLEDAPRWEDVVKEWEAAIGDRTMVAYNISFDIRMLDQTYAAFNIDRPKCKGVCAMQLATDYTGQRAKLVGGDHSALGDCSATLDLIRRYSVHMQESPPPVADAVNSLLDSFGISPAPLD